jgi:hypothetical protein
LFLVRTLGRTGGRALAARTCEQTRQADPHPSHHYQGIHPVHQPQFFPQCRLRLRRRRRATANPLPPLRPPPPAAAPTTAPAIPSCNCSRQRRTAGGAQPCRRMPQAGIWVSGPCGHRYPIYERLIAHRFKYRFCTPIFFLLTIHSCCSSTSSCSLSRVNRGRNTAQVYIQAGAWPLHAPHPLPNLTKKHTSLAKVDE